MKIIFLDVDGVLCKMGPNGNMGQWALSRSLLRNLSHVVKETGARLVLTSEWRRYDDGLRVLKRALRFKGIRIMSQTDINDKHRSEQIQDWLSSSKLPIHKTLVIDDLLIDPDQILCDPEEGLTEELALKAIERLNA